MNKQEYAEEVCTLLHEKGYETSIEENYRNNGSKIAIYVKTSPVSPIFTIEDDLMDPEEFVSYILTKVPADIDTNRLSDIIGDKEQVLSRVSYILVNSELNKSRTELVRRPINQTLELQYKVYVGDILPGGRVSLEHKHIEALGINEEELYIRARENTPIAQPYVLATMSELIGLPDVPLWVLTNDVRSNGASVILYDGIKQVLDDTIGENYILIPSSIHEWIVLPSDLQGKEIVTSMIREVNATVLDAEDILSDRPYTLISDGELIEL